MHLVEQVVVDEVVNNQDLELLFLFLVQLILVVGVVVGVDLAVQE
jgi:hypothetical protein